MSFVKTAVAAMAILCAAVPAASQSFQHDLARKGALVEAEINFCKLSYDDGGYRIRTSGESGGCWSNRLSHSVSMVLETSFVLRPQNEHVPVYAGIRLGVESALFSVAAGSNGRVFVSALQDNAWVTLQQVDNSIAVLRGREQLNTLRVEVRGVDIDVYVNGEFVIKAVGGGEPAGMAALAFSGLGDAIFKTFNARALPTRNSWPVIMSGSLERLDTTYFGSTHLFTGIAGQSFTYSIALPKPNADWYLRVENGTTGELVAHDHTRDSTYYLMSGSLPSDGVYTLSLVALDTGSYNSALFLSGTTATTIAAGGRSPGSFAWSQAADPLRDGYDLRKEWRDSLGSEYPTPDIVFVSASIVGEQLAVTINFAPESFDPARNKVALYIDVDQNEKTGIKQSPLPVGADFVFSIGGNTKPTFGHYGPNPQGIENGDRPDKRGSMGSVEVISDGFVFLVPLSDLRDDGRLRLFAATNVVLKTNADGDITTPFLDMVPGGRMAVGWIYVGE